MTIHYPALTVSISDTGFPTSIVQGNSGTVTLERNTSRGALQAYVRVTSTSFTSSNIFGASFTAGSGTATVTIDLTAITSLTAAETATLRVLTPTEATTADSALTPGTYAIGSGTGLSREFTLAHAAAPTVQIESVTAANSGTGAITVTLSQSGMAAISDVTVNVAANTADANPGADYVDRGTTGNFTGSFTDDSNITITIDRITTNEPAANANAKTLTVTLVDGAAYDLHATDGRSDTVDLIDSQPYFGVDQTQTVMADADPFEVNVVRLGNNTAAATAVNYSVTAGTPDVTDNDTDTLSFTTSETSKPVTVTRQTSPAPSDMTGKVTVAVTAPTNAGDYGLPSTGASREFDIDRAAAAPADPMVQIVSVTAADDGAGAITVTLSQSGTAAISNVTVNVASASNPGADYVDRGATGDFTSSFTGGSNITINIPRITTNEPAADGNAKTLTVTLTDGTAYDLGTTAMGTVDLIDSQPHFGVRMQTIAADANPFNVIISRVGNNNAAVAQVSYSITAGTPDVTDDDTTGTVAFAMSEATRTVAVTRQTSPMPSDATGNVVVVVTTGTGYGVANGSAGDTTFSIDRDAGTLADPTVQIVSVTAAGGGAGAITVTLSQSGSAAISNVTVNVASASNPGADYVDRGATGDFTGSFTDGSNITISIPRVTTNEPAADGNAKTLTVTLTDGTAYDLHATNGRSANVDLRDSQPHFGVRMQTIAASANPFNVIISRVGNNTAAANVDYSITAGAQDVTDDDTGMVAFTMGEMTKTVAVTRQTSPMPSATTGNVVVVVTSGTGYGVANGGSGDTTFSIDRDAAAPLAAPSLANANAASLTAGTMAPTITFTNSGGQSLTGCRVNPNLPTGLMVGLTTGNTSCQITGTPTVASSTATYTVTATNATGSDDATVSITVAAMTTTPPTTEAQMRVERNRDTEHVVTQFARTLSLGTVNTVRQRTLSLGPRSPRSQQSQSSVDVDVTGLLDFAMSRAGVEAPSSGRLLQSLGSSGGGVSGAMMDYAEDYAMSRARQVADASPAFVNDAQALETERFVGGLDDAALGDPAAGSAYADLAALGEGLVSSAAGGGVGGWTDGSTRFWASAEYGEISSSPRAGVSFDDDTTTISLGMEKHYGGDNLAGIAVSWLKGKPEFTAAGGVRGKAELEQWSLSPYIAHSFGSSRVWATVGVGVGSMDYSDNRGGPGAASSDTTSLLYAIGVEQDIAELGGVDLLGRVEAAGASINLYGDGSSIYDTDNIKSGGVRGELEAGYSVSLGGGGHYRPYVTVGYRADGGDSSSDDAVEYGGGLLVGTGHLTVVASARAQESTGGGNDDRTSYSLELSYDRDGDQRGLNLSVRNSIGNVDSGIWADSYDYGASSSPSMRGLMNMRAGYGHEIGNWLLTPYAESDFDNGDMARWSMGLGADFGTGALELTHTARPGQSAASAESMLQLRLEFQ